MTSDADTPTDAEAAGLDPTLIAEARQRISGQVRTVPVTGDALTTSTGAPVFFALEFMQHTGTFKARGALNFLSAHAEAGSLPEAGVTIASGGNAGVACAWAARRVGAQATVFLPENAPAPKVERLRSYGAGVRLHGIEYAEAAQACAEFAAESGALMSHAYDLPLIQAGAGTLVDEILRARPDTTVIAVSVGGGGLFAGVATAAHARGVRTIAVEPENCRSLNAALQAGAPVDVPVDSVAADSLGARRVSAAALAVAQRTSAISVLVQDSAIAETRRQLWADHRVVVEHAAATALTGVTVPAGGHGPASAKGDAAGHTRDHGQDSQAPVLSPTDRVCVVLCGANTSFDDLR